ncbi:MAG: molybdopterin cofactor-binding domain-containing protein, partial [Burkholderiales bacterium]
MSAAVKVDRRRFLQSAGALVVAFSWAAPSTLAQQTQKPRLPGSLQSNRMLDGWLRIKADGSVTVFTGKVELGQGILTALAQIASDELDVAYDRIQMVSADTSRSPDEGMTAGSLSVENSGTALRYACAEARALLVAAASKRLGVPVEQLTVAEGVVSAGSGKATYAELVGDASFTREATARVEPKSPQAHRMIGKSVARRDIPGKVTGKPSYVQDMRLPGMVFGRVVRPPSYRGELASCDEAGVRSMAGVVAVVCDGSFLAVAAAREEQAIKAAQALRASAKWRETADLPPAAPLL